MTMARQQRVSQNGTSASFDASEPPVELRDVLGSRQRRAASRHDAAPVPDAAPPTTVRLTDRAPAAASSTRKTALVVLMFLAIAACGVYVGVRSTSIGDALRTVSVVLVVTAVLIYLTALLFWLRGRRRPAGSATAPAPVASTADTTGVPSVVPMAPASGAVPPTGSVSPTVEPAAAPVPAAAHPADVGAGTPPRVPTLAEVAAQLDASRGRRPSEPAEAPAVPAPPAAAAPVPPAPTPAPPAPPVAHPVTPPAPPAPPAVAEPEPPVHEPVAVYSAAGPIESSAEVIHAIAPYAEVVGAPVIRERAVEAVEAAPAPVASAAVVPPPPVRPAAPVPPPPPAGRAVVPPPPPPAAPVPPPPPGQPARSAAEVFAAMAAAAPVEAPQPEATVADIPPPPPAPVVEAAVPDLEVDAGAHPGVALGSADLHHTSAEFVDLFAEGGRGEGTDDPGDDSDDERPVVERLVPGTELVSAEPLVPAVDAPGWTPPPVPADAGMVPHVAAADVTARSAVGSVAPVIVYRYRKWVLGQMMPGAAFGPIDVDRSPDEWLLLATCGVATLLAWTHEDHHFTYPVETWAEEILPAHGVRIRDRELARDLLLAAALHAGGVDSVPTERLRSYEPADLVTAMASIHVGLLRLYCGLGRIGPERVLADQYGIGPGDIPLH